MTKVSLAALLCLYASTSTAVGDLVCPEKWRNPVPWKEVCATQANVADLYTQLSITPQSFGSTTSTAPTGRAFRGKALEGGNGIGIKSYFGSGFLGVDVAWPTRKIPFLIYIGDASDPENATGKEHSRHEQIRAALCWWQSVTPVKFVELDKPSGKPTIEFHAGTGAHAGSCSVLLPNKYGFSYYVNSSCLTSENYEGTGSFAHEIGHVLGLRHEHERWDVDEWVKIANRNGFEAYLKALGDNKPQIAPHTRSLELLEELFTKAAPTSFTFTQQFRYDLSSIMHYPLRAWGGFARAPDAPVQTSIGSSKCISIGDAAAIKFKYENKEDKLPD